MQAALSAAIMNRNKTFHTKSAELQFIVYAVHVSLCMLRGDDFDVFARQSSALLFATREMWNKAEMRDVLASATACSAWSMYCQCTCSRGSSQRTKSKTKYIGCCVSWMCA